ncbi:MAG: hypothetical protein KGK34_11855 [Chloroflexota bacterium]|nr:hypothetical protein [Chloroflexota bacterium]
MPDTSQLLQGVGVVLVAVVLLWFTLGTQRNLRRGDHVMKWLQSGLPLLGPKTTLRWLGSSVAELKIVDPRAPCRSALAMIVLEPRDLSALWALARGRGRRDFLLLRLDLVRAPRFRADLIDPRAWTAHNTRRDDGPFAHEASWTDSAGTLVTVRSDGADLARLYAAWERVARASGGAWRISVRQLVPHLEVHCLFPALDQVDSLPLFAAVKELTEVVSAPR